MAGTEPTQGALLSALGDRWIETERESLALNRDTARLWLDVEAFQAKLALGRAHAHPPDVNYDERLDALAKGTELYRDDFLAGFTLSDSPGFDDWQFFQTEALREDLAGALEWLARGHGEHGAYEPAIGYARRWVAVDPLRESAQRLLMRLFAWSGQRAAALRQYAECQRVLQAELGAPAGRGRGAFS